MQEAHFTHLNSPSSALASAFLKATGMYGLLSNKVSKPHVNRVVTNSYSETVRDYAKSQGPWSSLADKLSVHITEHGPSVTFDGSDDERKLMEHLEYGGPDNPPRSVIRVMEEEIRQQYEQDKKRMS